ncbi:hypothetical protein RISK_004012 [Rhodopirellula islandica]|uniref:Uncharacterized protein n=1 Tax=Rhodopirellula islandica TaxID=595434 RepID=A0A0J1BBX3_RHOIS|nr:hypothetical protein RISK_004012 [Rhodopirellula islandica]
MHPVVFTAFKPPATICDPFGIKLARAYPPSKVEHGVAWANAQTAHMVLPGRSCPAA